MQAQMAPQGAGEGGVPAITKEKTKEMFFYSEEKKVESMKKLMSSQTGMRQEEVMIEMMVEQAKLSDELYEKFGTDEDEFNSALMHFNLMHDPEV